MHFKKMLVIYDPPELTVKPTQIFEGGTEVRLNQTINDGIRWGLVEVIKGEMDRARLAVKINAYDSIIAVIGYKEDQLEHEVLEHEVTAGCQVKGPSSDSSRHMTSRDAVIENIEEILCGLHGFHYDPRLGTYYFKPIS